VVRTSLLGVSEPEDGVFMNQDSRPWQSFEAGLKEALRDPSEAAAYLNSAIEDGSQEGSPLALRDVADARGIASVARHAMFGLQTPTASCRRRETRNCRLLR
jgi:hypothetical protein